MVYEMGTLWGQSPILWAWLTLATVITELNSSTQLRAAQLLSVRGEHV